MSIKTKHICSYTTFTRRKNKKKKRKVSYFLHFQNMQFMHTWNEVSLLGSKVFSHIPSEFSCSEKRVARFKLLGLLEQMFTLLMSTHPWTPTTLHFVNWQEELTNTPTLLYSYAYLIIRKISQIKITVLTTK